MKKTLWLAIGVAIILLVVVIIFRGNKDDRAIVVPIEVEDIVISDEVGGIESSKGLDTSQESDPDNGNEVDGIEPPITPLQALITYTDDGYSPEEITIKVGESVMWSNNSNGSMWVATDLHPTHEIYGGTTRKEHCPNDDNTAFDQCEGGDDYYFVFHKAGVWEYHDHIRPNHTGVIIVEE